MWRARGFLARDAAVTEINAALREVAHDAQRVIAGCRKVPHRQGTQDSISSGNGHETRLPGRADAIAAMAERHPHLADDAVVRGTLHRWLS